MGTALAVFGMVASLAGGVTQAQGQKLSGKANAQSYMYQSQIATNNAKIARQNAEWTIDQGDVMSTTEGEKTAAEIGSMKARQAAGGIDVNTGSALSAREAAQQIGLINALTIKSNAARAAWGYKVDETNEKAQAELDKKAAGYSLEGASIASTATLLSSAGQFGTQFGNLINSGSTGGGSGSSNGSMY